MKKGLILILGLLLATLAFSGMNTGYASSNTTHTYSLSTKGELIITQDAYLSDQYKLNLGLLSPQDLFFDSDDLLYIVDYDAGGDASKARIVIYDPTIGSIVDQITHPDFLTPTGIAINAEDHLFVADPQANKIFHFDDEGQHVQTIERPESRAYVASQFKPKKIAVDDNANIYVVGEGDPNGVLQLSYSGEFLGYFASNDVYYSPEERIRKFFYDLFGQEMGGVKLPSPFSNVFVDRKGILYSTTSSQTMENRLKKHSTSGSNLFSGIYNRTEQMTDVYVNRDGIIFTSSVSEGYIDVYSKYGDFIFSFGGTSDEDIIGLYSSLESIAVNSRGEIYTVDSEQGYLLSYMPTDYAKGIYRGLNLFEEGQYDEAAEQWEDVLMLNQISKLGNDQLAKCYMYQEDYDQAATHFELAENREFYSDTYWEIRNLWIQDHLSMIFILMGGFAVFVVALKIINRKYHIFTPIGHVLGQAKKKMFFRELSFMKKIIKNPGNSFYEIKKGSKGSMSMALLMLFTLFAVFLINSAFKGFLFQMTAVEDLNLFAIIFGYFSIVLAFVFSNYLITSINRGESGLKKIFIQTTYAFPPLIIGMLLSTLLTHIVTLDEAFFVGFTLFLAYAYTFILLLTGITEIQNYEFKDTLKSLLLTLLLMIILTISVLFVQMMFSQIVDFIVVVFREVFMHGFS